MKINKIRPRDITISIHAVIVWMAIIGFQITHNTHFLTMGIGVMVSGLVIMVMFRKSYINESKQAISTISEYINSIGRKSGKTLETFNNSNDCRRNIQGIGSNSDMLFCHLDTQFFKGKFRRVL